jgi:phosphoribosyl 1,2-cyclic phosphate phosphodiesterase
MKVHILGTGAADGIPGLFQTNRVSEIARKEGGKDRRTRSAAVINDTLKIDFGPDTFSQALAQGLRPSDWTGIVFTHSHDDHLSRKELQYALFPFTEDVYAPFTIYCNSFVGDKLRDTYDAWPLEILDVHLGEPFVHDGVEITAIEAYHKIDESCFNYVLNDGTATFLYGTDTGVWREETWRALQGVSLDGLLIECTNGKMQSPYFGHLNCAEVIDVVTRLRDEGILKSGAPVVTTHHSATGDMTHAELEAFFSPHGIQPGFDGMILEF